MEGNEIHTRTPTPLIPFTIPWGFSKPLSFSNPRRPLSFFRSHTHSNRLLWDDGNIIAALENPSRVHRIVIHAANPLLSKLATVLQEPFPALKHLDLEWDFEGPHYSKGLPIPEGFLGGSSPLLQHLRLKCIFFCYDKDLHD